MGEKTIDYKKNEDGTIKKTEIEVRETDGIDSAVRIMELDIEIQKLRDKIIEYEAEKQKIIDLKDK